MQTLTTNVSVFCTLYQTFLNKLMSPPVNYTSNMSYCPPHMTESRALWTWGAHTVTLQFLEVMRHHQGKVLHGVSCCSSCEWQLLERCHTSTMDEAWLGTHNNVLPLRKLQCKVSVYGLMSLGYRFYTQNLSDITGPNRTTMLLLQIQQLPSYWVVTLHWYNHLDLRFQICPSQANMRERWRQSVGSSGLALCIFAE